MPFYESIHSAIGILQISINEQYIWEWLTKNDKPKFRVRELVYTIEGRLEDWDWGISLNLDNLILQCYKAHEQRFKNGKSEISD